MIRVELMGNTKPTVYVNGKRVKGHDIGWNSDQVEVFALDYATFDDVKGIELGNFPDLFTIKLGYPTAGIEGLSCLSISKLGDELVVGFAFAQEAREWSYPWNLNMHISRIETVCESGKYKGLFFIDESDESDSYYYYTLKFTLKQPSGTLENIVVPLTGILEKINRDVCMALALLCQKRVAI